jgi:hypothetical protein
MRKTTVWPLAASLGGRPCRSATDRARFPEISIRHDDPARTSAAVISPVTASANASPPGAMVFLRPPRDVTTIGVCGLGVSVPARVPGANRCESPLFLSSCALTYAIRRESGAHVGPQHEISTKFVQSSDVGRPVPSALTV